LYCGLTLHGTVSVLRIFLREFMKSLPAELLDAAGIVCAPELRIS
jgi:ABC-type glycerol-3-phosphate transport system permease component